MTHRPIHPSENNFSPHGSSVGVAQRTSKLCRRSHDWELKNSDGDCTHIAIVPGEEMSDTESTTTRSGRGRRSKLLTNGTLVFVSGEGGFCTAWFFESLKPVFTSSVPTLRGSSVAIHASCRVSHPLMPATSTKTVEALYLCSSAAAAGATRETMSISWVSVTTNPFFSLEPGAGINPCGAAAGCRCPARRVTTMISPNR